MCSEHESEWHATDLLEESPASARDFDVAADIAMDGAIRAAWEEGWLPSDLQELARRRVKPLAAGYLAEAIVLECARYSVATLHPRWRADLATISAGFEPSTQTPQMLRWAARNAMSRSAALTVVLDVLSDIGCVSR